MRGFTDPAPYSSDQRERLPHGGFAHGFSTEAPVGLASAERFASATRNLEGRLRTTSASPFILESEGRRRQNEATPSAMTLPLFTKSCCFPRDSLLNCHE